MNCEEFEIFAANMARTVRARRETGARMSGRPYDAAIVFAAGDLPIRIRLERGLALPVDFDLGFCSLLKVLHDNPMCAA